MRDDTHYERLSALDQTFLAFETANAPMHVALTGIFEPGSLATEDGGVDIDRIRRHIGSRLRFIPRYRQRVVTLPLLNDAIWIDDDVVRSRLPRAPRQPAAARRRAATAAALRRDPRARARSATAALGAVDHRGARGRAVCDGGEGPPLHGGRHRRHRPARGAARHRADARPSSRPTTGGHARCRANATCSSTKCVVGRATSLDAARRVGDWLRAPGEAGRAAGAGVTAFVRLLGKLGGAPATPFNQPIGPHRRVDWFSISLADVKAIRTRLGGTLNDVVLTTVAGAVGRFLAKRRCYPSGEFRTVVPVSVRAVDERGATGNRVSVWLTTLPVTERDPRRRLAKVSAATARAQGGSGRDGGGAAHAGGGVHDRQRRQPGRTAHQQRPALQPDRHQRARAAGAVLPAQRAHGRRRIRTCRCSRTRASAWRC